MKNTYLTFAIMALIFFNGCSLTQLETDNDNDGVLDYYDKCKNTPFLEIVNSSGCTLK